MREAKLSQVARMRVALHDLAQPLTALECRLYLALMVAPTGGSPDPAEMRAAIEDGLVECGRLMAAVRAMQEGLDEE